MSVGNKLLHFLSVFSVVFVVVAFLTSPVLAATTDTISFQSKVVNSDGTNIPNNTYNFRFIMYSVSSGGSSLWQEDKSISIVDGVLSTQLGSGTAFPSTLFDNADLYLQICFDANGTDLDSSNTNCGGSTHRYEEVFGSRKQITAVPVAFRAKGLVDGTGTPLLVEDIFRQGGNSFGVTAVLGTKDANPLQLITNNTTAVTILSNGNVGIGATSPGQKLTVDGSLGIIEGGTSPTYHTIFQGGDQSADITYTLPTSVGISGQVLSTDGSGVLSWVTGGTGGGSLFNSNGTVLNGDYIEVAHNTDSFDVLSLGWYQDAVTGLWRQLENTSKSITLDLSNEFNPAFTQRKKTSSVSLNYNENDLGTGADGAVTISTSRSINTTNTISGRSCADGGDAVNYSVTALTANTATLESSPSAGCLSTGDEVLLINLRGTASAYENVGNYETLRVSTVVGGTVTFTTNKTKYYGDGASNDSNIGVGTGAQAVMLQRVPNYTNVTVNGGVSFYPDAWVSPTGAVNNGAGEGGVMFFRANGAVAINGTITAAARGYKGGTYQGDTVTQLQGESTTGSGARAGAYKAEGGGGGGGVYCAGGGGGGYATAGVVGTRSGTSCSTGGVAGPLYPSAGNAPLTKLYFGSGGGSGSTGYASLVWTYDGGAGGDGGGIIYVAANSITVSGALTASGAGGGGYGDSGTASDIPSGGGGGGAGGSVKLIGNVINLGTALTTAAAGAGGTSGTASNRTDTWDDLGGRAFGGAGGVGIVRVEYTTSLSGSSSPAYSAASLNYNTYAVFRSQPIQTPKSISYGNISWTESLATYGEIQIQTRSGDSNDPTDGTWEAWGPVLNATTINTADTHTDWTGSNATVADGDITRDVIGYEDEDETTAGNLTKATLTVASGYVERTLGAIDLSAADFITLWVRSSTAGNKITLGFGEAAATENTEVVTVNELNTWQKVYWDISDVAAGSRDVVTKFRITGVENGQVLYFDNIKAESYLTTSAGSAITSTAAEYIQYRVILSTTSTAYTPTVSTISLQYTNATGTYAIDADRVRAISDPNYDGSSRFNAVEYNLDTNKGIYTKVTGTSVESNGAINTGNGADGAITVTTNLSINTTNLIAGRSCADGGDAVNYSVTGLTSMTATLESVPSAGCLSVGDEILLINLQGTPSAYGNVGNYETLRINSISGDTITFASTKTKYYGDGAIDDTNVGVGVTAQTVMLQRVPNYTDVTVDAGVYFNSDFWVSPNGAVNNGAGEGGVMFFRASGAVSVNGWLNSNSRGYIGSTYAAYVPAAQYQGESTTGTGSITTAVKAEGGGGGGGSSGGQQGCAGGGGGGYATAGGTGGRSGVLCGAAGTGGNAYPTNGNSTLTKLYFGSAGAAGSTGHTGSAWSLNGGNGARGGGIVYVSANSVTVSGGVIAYGGAGGSQADAGGSDIVPGGGGGGAGGSIKIIGNVVNLGSGIVNANGGAGGTTGVSGFTAGGWTDLGGYATGGAGGSGIVAVQVGSSISGSSTPAYSSTVEALSNYSVFISDEIATPNAVNYKTISWLTDLARYGMVQLQTRSGSTNNSTDGTWEAWKPALVSTNVKTLENMNTPGNWTVSNLNAPAAGDVTRNVDYYEDEDESTVTNLTKLSSGASTVGYAEATISAIDLSTTDLVSMWVRSSAVGNVVKLGIGESVATENAETFYVSTSNTWQKVYWDISDIDKSQRNAITKLRVSILSANTIVYVDSIEANQFATNANGVTILSTPNEYIQYRAILTTTSNVGLSPKLHNVHIDWNDGFKLVQVDANTTRLYNMTGETQNMRLVLGSSAGGGGGSCGTCFVNGGNTFGQNGVLGTLDAYDLVFMTDSTTRLALLATGEISVSGDVLPSADIAYSLGSSAYRWQDVYVGPASLHLVSTTGETTTARDWNFSIIEADGATEGNFVFKEGVNEYMTIAKDGKVGIGVSNPLSALQVSSGSAYVQLDPGTNESSIWLKNSTVSLAAGLIATNSDSGLGLRFWTSDASSGTEKMRLTGSGALGIGTSSILSGAKTGIVGGLLYVGNSNTPYGAQVSGSTSGKGFFGSNMYIDGADFRTFGTHASYGYSGMDASWGAINFYTGSGATTAGSTITPAARVTIASSGYVTFANGHNDLAENYLLVGTALRGSLISLSQSNEGSVELADGIQGNIIGIVSTAPGAVMDADGGFVIGAETKPVYTDEKTPIALQGTAPLMVLVDTDTIKAGDTIGASSVAGYGQKRNSGLVIGRAMESLDYTKTCPVINDMSEVVWPNDDGKNSLHPCFTLPDGKLVGKIMVAIQPLSLGGGTAVADSFWSEVTPTAIQTSHDVIASGITGTKGNFSILNSMTLNINDKFLVDDQGNATAMSIVTPKLKGFGTGIAVDLQAQESFSILAGNTKIFEASVEGVKVSSDQAGTIVIPAGQASVTISSLYIKDASIVLVTPSKPVPVGVTVDATNKKFTISLDAAKSEDITVRWFIVNNTAP